jgi:ligand-binding SRPBCC domain-containing protein
MKVHCLERAQMLPITPEEAWDFFSSADNLEAITPPELGFEILSGRGRIHEAQIICYRVRILPGIRVRWVTEIKAVKEGRSFVDEQRAGPYRFWHHLHSFEPVEGGVRVRDQVHYALPFGPLGGIARVVFVRAKLEQIFRFREKLLAERFGTL